MRILVISNFYPPFHRGGMGLSCQSVVTGLASRGHDVQVLTSRHGVRKPVFEEGIDRLLHLEMSLQPLRNALNFFFRKRNLDANLANLRKRIRDFEPDVVFIWGMWNLHPSIASTAETICQNRVLYRFADYWPLLPPQSQLYWNARGRSFLTRALRRILAPIALRILEIEDRSRPAFPHSYCVSKAVRRKLSAAGLPVEASPIIHTGFDLESFLEIEPVGRDEADSLRRLLLIGRLVPEKGAQTALRALVRLDQQGEDFNLTIVGDGDRDFIEDMQWEVMRQNLGSRVRMLGRIATEKIPSVMSEHGVVLVPSLWEDPLPRVALEAMAAARIVVASNVGGLPEIIDPETTGIVFKAGSSKDLAAALVELSRDPVKAERLANGARQMAVESFELQANLDRIERTLEAVAKSSSPMSAAA